MIYDGFMLAIQISGFDLWVTWNPSFKWGSPSVPHAHKEPFCSQEAGV